VREQLSADAAFLRSVAMKATLLVGRFNAGAEATADVAQVSKEMLRESVPAGSVGLFRRTRGGIAAFSDPAGDAAGEPTGEVFFLGLVDLEFTAKHL
jgi:hypothetical protein